MLQPALVDQEILMGLFSLVEFPVEEVDGLLDLSDLFDQTMMNGIATQFHVWTVGSSFQTALRNLKRYNVENRLGNRVKVGQKSLLRLLLTVIIRERKIFAG